MKNTTKTMAIGVFAVFCLGEAAAADDLTVVGWGGPHQEGLHAVFWAPFAEANGITINEETWDGGIGVLRTKIEGGNNTWDIVLTEAPEVAAGCDEGLFEEIDPAMIGGVDRYIPGAVSTCGVGALVWNIMLAYDGDKLADGPKDWADFFDTTKFPGKRALRNNAKWSLEIALLADGVPQDQVYDLLRTPEGVDRAFAKLDTIKSDLVFWKSGGQPIEMLAAGDVVMAAAYNGRIFNANKNDGKNFKVVWQDAPYTMDSWVIMKGSANMDEALKLIEFMGRPENQAMMVPYSPYGTTAVGADALVDATLASQLPTAPENLAVVFHEDATFWNDNGDKLAERWAAWTGTN